MTRVKSASGACSRGMQDTVKSYSPQKICTELRSAWTSGSRCSKRKLSPHIKGPGISRNA